MVGKVKDNVVVEVYINCLDAARKRRDEMGTKTLETAKIKKAIEEKTKYGNFYWVEKENLIVGEEILQNFEPISIDEMVVKNSQSKTGILPIELPVTIPYQYFNKEHDYKKAWK